MVSPGPVTVNNYDGTKSIQAYENTDFSVRQRVLVYEGDLVSSGGTPETMVYTNDLHKGIYVKMKTADPYKSLTANGNYEKVVEKVAASTDKPVGIIITQNLPNLTIPKVGHYNGGGEPTYPNNYSELRETTVMHIDTGAVMLGGYLPNTAASGGSDVILNPGDKVALTGTFHKPSGLPELKKAVANDYSIGESYVGATIAPQTAVLVQFANKVEKVV
jgi:hypothetical protein